MQFDKQRNVCPIHFYRHFLISSSAGSWNVALALQILVFTSASEPSCQSMMPPSDTHDTSGYHGSSSNNNNNKSIGSGKHNDNGIFITTSLGFNYRKIQ
ncbi:unnamed protein product [Schistosoma curassoni]|uniref:Secreted protein n=1 Tax=Schistosoma curassoni TaxID=6186 RepID=A0A183KUP1_9TREM|nr:unnamed protein product [Schistosoma curassoni]